MSEKLLKFLLSELQMVRIRCQNRTCGIVAEMTIEQLGTRYFNGLCPFCNTALQLPQANALSELAHAIGELAKVRDRVEIEFVLPDKS